MNVRELKHVLDSMAVPEGWYALNDGLKIDAFVIYENYMFREFFYYSEKGERVDHRMFKTENEACVHLLDRIKTQVSFLKQ